MPRHDTGQKQYCTITVDLLCLENSASQTKILVIEEMQSDAIGLQISEIQQVRLAALMHIPEVPL
jgi:hypothetical protein